MTIGICCQWLELKRKRDGTTEYINSIKEKSLQLGRYLDGKYTESQIIATYRNNIREVSNALDKGFASGIRLFRLSSGLLPLMDKVPQQLWNNDVVIGDLRELGRKFNQLQIRTSTHPGQFTVLSSDSDDVVTSSIREIENHSWIFDQMGLEASAICPINIHGGKADRQDRLVESIQALSQNARNRLTLENDETCYNVTQLIKVHEKTGVSIVFDSHHHEFNTGGISGGDAARLATSTWLPWIKPIQHLSNTEPGLEGGSFVDRRKHSFNLHYIPEYQKDMLINGLIDIEMEFKGKNLGVLPNLTSLGLDGVVCE